MRKSVVVILTLCVAIVLGCGDGSKNDKPFIGSGKQTIAILGPINADTALTFYQDVSYSMLRQMKEAIGKFDRSFSEFQLSKIKFTDKEERKLTRFDFFNLYIVNENIGEVKVASINNVSENFSQTLVMDNDINYAEYFNKQGSQFKIETVYNEDIEIGDVFIVFEFNMLGIFEPKK